MNSRVRGNLAVRIWVLLILATAYVAPARADRPSAYGPELEGFEYPFTPERFSFPSQGQTVSMTFMDVAPNISNAVRRPRPLRSSTGGSRRHRVTQVSKLKANDKDI